ncbi:MAG: hypothetical protein WBD73_04055 [Candidatus Acidiferrales bacterium]
MSAALQVGIVRGWRYLVRERDGDSLFAIVRRDVERDILEDEIAFCFSQEIAAVLATALVAHEQRKNDLCGDFIRRNF